MRRSRPAKALRVVALCVTLVAVLATAVAAPADAGAPASDVTGTASPLQATLATATPSLQVTGPLAGLVNPLVSGSLGVVFGLLQSLPSTVLTPLLSAITGSTNGATTPTSNNGPFTPVNSASPPSPCGTASCYSTANAAVGAGVATLSSGTLQGWVQYDDNGANTTNPQIQSSSRIQNLNLGLLGANLLQLGTVTATSNCVKGGTSSGTASLAATTILGAIGVQTSGGTLQVKLPGASTFNALSAVVPATVSVSGLSVGLAQSASGALKVTVPISLTTLLTALGLPAIPFALTKADVAVTVTIGVVTPDTTTTTAARTWGLEVGLDLAMDVEASILGTGVALTLPSGATGTSYGNLADLRFGYATCTAGSLLSVQPNAWVPPELS